MPRLEQLQRSLRLLSALDRAGAGLTVAELAAETNLTPRSIYRYLHSIEAAGYPLFSERNGREAHWRFVDGYRFTRDPRFNAMELLALNVARDLLLPLKGTWAGDAAASASRKLEHCLSVEARAYVDALRSAFVARTPGAASYADHAKNLETLTSAIAAQTRCRMIYDSQHSRARTPRKVYPYAIFFQDGALYLVAYDERRREIRTFAIQRIVSLEATPERFTRPESFSLADYLRDAFRMIRGARNYDVVVRVSAELALYASERAWHPSQRAKRLPDGGVELCFEVSGLEEVASWILGFRGAATAVAPQELRTMVREAGKQIADKHAEPTKETPPARAGMATEKQKQRARG